MVQQLLGGVAEELPKVLGPDGRRDREAGAGDGLVDEEAARGPGEPAAGVHLAEAVVDLERGQAQQRGDETAEAGGGPRGGLVVAIRGGAEEGEGGHVGSGLGDDEVVDVEELGDAGEGGVALVVARLAP